MDSMDSTERLDSQQPHNNRNKTPWLACKSPEVGAWKEYEAGIIVFLLLQLRAMSGDKVGRADSLRADMERLGHHTNRVRASSTRLVILTICPITSANETLQYGNGTGN
jgi:hypothetical protein